MSGNTPTQPTAEQIAEAMREAEEAPRGYERYATDPKHIKVLADHCAEWVGLGERVDLLLSELPNATPQERSLVEHANRLLAKWPGRT